MSDNDLTLSVAEWGEIQCILQQLLPETEVWAFGSRVKPNTPKPYSDLDIVIRGQQPLSLELSAELDEAFDESDLPWKVDILDWHTTRLGFQRIIKEHYAIIQMAGEQTR